MLSTSRIVAAHHKFEFQVFHIRDWVADPTKHPSYFGWNGSVTIDYKE